MSLEALLTYFGLLVCEIREQPWLHGRGSRIPARPRSGSVWPSSGTAHARQHPRDCEAPLLCSPGPRRDGFIPVIFQNMRANLAGIWKSCARGALCKLDRLRVSLAWPQTYASLLDGRWTAHDETVEAQESLNPTTTTALNVGQDSGL